MMKSQTQKLEELTKTLEDSNYANSDGGCCLVVLISAFSLVVVVLFLVIPLLSYILNWWF